MYTEAADSLPGSQRDVITDFKQGEDRIDLRRINAHKGAGDQAFEFLGAKHFTGAGGELKYYYSGGNTIVAGDIDGDKKADFEIKVIGKIVLLNTDFRR